MAKPMEKNNESPIDLENVEANAKVDDVTEVVNKGIKTSLDICAKICNASLALTKIHGDFVKIHNMKQDIRKTFFGEWMGLDKDMSKKEIEEAQAQAQAAQ